MSGVNEKRAAAERRAAALSKVDDIRVRRDGFTGLHVRSADRMPGSVARMVPFPAKQLRSQETVWNGVKYFEFTGQATVFDMPYPMWDEFGPYDEVVDTGAERVTLGKSPDVAFLENHRGLTMARTKNGTLQLSSSDGLDVRALTNPMRDDIIRLKMAVDDGLIDEMSFAFLIDEGWWSEDFTTFHIAQFNIDRGDVSAVNYGANPFTSIAARQRSMWADIDHMPMHLARAAMERLQRKVADTPAAPKRFDGLLTEPNTRVTPSTVEIKDLDARQTARRGRSLASVQAQLDLWASEERDRLVLKAMEE